MAAKKSAKKASKKATKRSSNTEKDKTDRSRKPIRVKPRPTK